jgi:serine/threonine protein kinase/beta-lactam-binding protein with PASTA domain
MQTADPLLGRALEGRYRVQSMLARGGMSTVYVGLDERLDRLVAIKVMSTALSADPVFVDRFTREARAAARLSHVNVVSVYDQGNDTGHAFLIMELVRGRTLRDLLREGGAMQPAAAVSLMAPILAALSAAHRAGLVHRDVKPENILLSDDGVVKVADFGLARAIESDRSSTQTGVMMGTVAYCSPEQIAQGTADARSDVYSAGVVLYELLTGAAPFHGESAMAVAYQHVHSRVPAPSNPAGTGQARLIPQALDVLVQRATSREPAGRPADAGAFLAELHEVRTALRMPIVAVPARPRLAVNGYGSRLPGPPAPGDGTTGRLAPAPGPGYPPGSQHPATALLPGAGPGYRSSAAPPPLGAPPLHPPLRPPPQQPRPGGPPSAADQNRIRRRARRRRMVLALLLVLLLGVAAAFGSWWYLTGRYTSVPDVRSVSMGTARTTLEDAGLKVAAQPKTEYSETAEADTVIATEPSAGNRVLPGDVVVLVVSSGKERFAVPGVAGQTEAQARAALAAIPGAQVVTSQASDDSVATGQVIKTDPPADAQVPRNQTITVYLSTGPPVLSVPNVKGQPRADAIAALQGAGFTPVVTEEFSDSVALGKVIRQSPDAGKPAVKFTDVAIVVSLGPELVAVPPTAGNSQADATAKLVALGLNVKIEKVFGGTLNIVVGMDPLSGTKVKKGATVTLSVA